MDGKCSLANRLSLNGERTGILFSRCSGVGQKEKLSESYINFFYKNNVIRTSRIKFPVKNLEMESFLLRPKE